MTIEKLILVEGVDTVELYGPANSYYNKVISYFPKIKVVARGNSIKVFGEEMEIERFEDKLMTLIDVYSKYQRINETLIEQIFEDQELDIAETIDSDVLVYGNNGRMIKARTINQKRLVDLYEKNDLLFAVGPAGSGKTYTAIALAVRALKNKEVKRIILTRPAVEAGEKLGFLPGDMKEKLDPYLQPLYDALNDMIPQRKLTTYMEDGTVQIAPLAYMRGRTLDNAFVILDEAQNTTFTQLKMFLTRMGRNAKFIVTGDITQVDLPRKSDSGLARGIKILRSVKNIGVVEFDTRDIVRHPLVKYIVNAFEAEIEHEDELRRLRREEERGES
jgi:phosphate starvation-inducible PhoH-like protein